MTKRDLIIKLHEKLKVYAQKDVAHAVNVVFNSMIDALKHGERIEIRGFGNITIRERNARLGRNPKSGAEVRLEKRNIPFFKTGKELRLKVDNK